MKYKLPIKYHQLTPKEKREVRGQYIKEQDNLCYHCGFSIHKNPPTKILKRKVDRKLFPKNFFTHPIHLHHNHRTGFTIGAVHAYCNAILFQYYGE